MKKLTLQVVVGFLFFFGSVGAFLTMQYGGDLVRDIALRSESLEVHPTARVRRADCTRYYFLMSACKIEYENRPVGQPVTNIQTLQSTSFLVFGSMGGERSNLITGLVGTIIPGIEMAIRDVQLGAGGMDDYPYGGYGYMPDLPFYLLRSIGPSMEDLGMWSIPAGSTMCPSSPAPRFEYSYCAPTSRVS